MMTSGLVIYAVAGRWSAPGSRSRNDRARSLDQVDGMRWCRYATEPAVPDAAVSDSGAPAFEGAITLRTGRFVSGGLLGQGDARRVLAAADAAPDAGSCELASVAFVVLWPLRGGQVVGSALAAELDGCGLLFGDGMDPQPLPADVRELLTALPAA
jgi:hypothetical protein